MFKGLSTFLARKCYWYSLHTQTYNSN